MPLVQIAMGAGRTPEEERYPLTAVRQAGTESTERPPAAVRAWIVEPATLGLVTSGSPPAIVCPRAVPAGSADVLRLRPVLTRLPLTAARTRRSAGPTDGRIDGVG